MSFDSFAADVNSFKPSETLTRSILSDRNTQLSLAGTGVGGTATLGGTWALVKEARKKPAPPPPPPPSFSDKLERTITENPTATAIAGIAVVVGGAYVASRMANRNKK